MTFQIGKLRIAGRRSRCCSAAAAGLLALLPLSVRAQSTTPAAPAYDHLIVADPPAARVSSEASSPPCDPHCPPTASGTPPHERSFRAFAPGADDDAFSITSVARGLSTHKSMFVLPLSWSPDYDGENTEMIFQLSAKHRLFGSHTYFGYSQKSFWQLYNADKSRPFRETNYNPELFYRWLPASPEDTDYWGADLGIEHESNGKSAPNSRSWNRLYVAPFRAKGKSLIYGKLWYRLPEKDKEYPTDPDGDDNPGILDYYGYGELHMEREFGAKQMIQLMARGNLEHGHGAVNLNYTIPSRDESIFYQLYVWHGYGESLADYKDSVTRVGIGVALTR